VGSIHWKLSLVELAHTIYLGWMVEVVEEKTQV